MNVKEYRWRAKDGLELFSRLWQGERVNGLICLVHGLGEHGGRYEWVAEYITSRGYALLSMDNRGHGRSGGRRGHAGSYEEYMDDIGILLQEAKNLFPEHKPFLYGHSMGGNLVLNYVLRRKPVLEGVIVTGPLLGLTFPVPAWKNTMAEIFSHILPILPVPNGLVTDHLSRAPEVAPAYVADPLVHSTVTAKFPQVLKAANWAMEYAEDWELPLLLMHGGDDKITDPAMTRRFAELAGKTCIYKEWAGLYHELHNEPEKEQVLATLIDWVGSVAS